MCSSFTGNSAVPVLCTVEQGSLGTVLEPLYSLGKEKFPLRSLSTVTLPLMFTATVNVTGRARF